MNTAAESGGDYYGASRNVGNNKFVSGLNSAAHSIIEEGASLFGQRKEYHDFIMKNANYTPKSKDEEHRRVSLAQSGFEEVGSAYDRIQASASAMDDSANMALKTSVDRLAEEMRRSREESARRGGGALVAGSGFSRPDGAGP
jgi:hypothetical protein